MEWYRNVRVDDVVVPSDKCMRSSFPSQEKWKRWGINEMDSVDSLDYNYALGNSAANESDFSCETLVDVDKNEMDCLIGKGDQAEFSGVPGGISESSNCWTAFLNNQDYQLDGFPWNNQTDENFMNSLLVDDLHSGDQFPIYGSPKSQGAYTMENELLTKALLEFHVMGGYEQKDSPKFPFTFDWGMEQHDASRHILQNMMISTAPPLENATHLVCASGIISDDPSVEETVLKEFGSAVQKMTNKNRLCFRDAMYRLANNSEKYSRFRQGEHVPSEKYFKTTLPNLKPRFTETDALEPRTNSVDRTVADLLFNRPYQRGDCHQDFSSEIKPRNRCPQKLPAFITGR